MLRFLEIGQAHPRLSTSHIAGNHVFGAENQIFKHRRQQCKHYDHSFAKFRDDCGVGLAELSGEFAVFGVG